MSDKHGVSHASNHNVPDCIESTKKAAWTFPNTFLLCLRAQMHSFSAAAFLLALALSFPIKASKCPRLCKCDSSKLTVSCIGKNLTEVPAVDEVRISNVQSTSLLLNPNIWVLFAKFQMCTSFEFSSVQKEIDLRNALFRLCLSHLYSKNKTKLGIIVLNKGCA